MKLVNNLVGLFVGENSKKRQMGVFAGGIAMTCHLMGWISPEEFKVAMYLISFWTGIAFSNKLSKMAKDLK